MSTIKGESVDLDPLALLARGQGQAGNEKSAQNALFSPPQYPPPPIQSSANFQQPSPISSQTFIPDQGPIDTIDTLAVIFTSKCRTVPLDPNTISKNAAGLQLFARASAWRFVVELSESLLVSPDVRGSRASLTLTQIQRLRLEGLFKLKMFDELSREVGDILENEGQGQHDRSVDGESSSISMRLLLAEVKAMTGRGEEAFAQLYVLRSKLQGRPDSTFQKSWILRATNSIVNAAIRQRMWRVAISELFGMLVIIRQQYATLGVLVSKEVSCQFYRAEIVLLCRLSRILLQVGSMKPSSTYFEEASALLSGNSNLFAEHPRILEDMSCQVKLTLGLTMFGRDQYEEALRVFGEVLESEQTKQTSDKMDALSLFNAGPPKDFDAIDATSDDMEKYFAAAVHSEESLLDAAVNNFAICALYLRNIPAAVAKIENLILDDPVRHMTDPIVFNLCTLYDLSCAPDVSTTKKKVLQRVAAIYYVDDPILHWRSFRLN